LWAIWKARSDKNFANGDKDVIKKVVDDISVLSWRWG